MEVNEKPGICGEAKYVQRTGKSLEYWLGVRIYSEFIFL